MTMHLRPTASLLLAVPFLLGTALGQTPPAAVPPPPPSMPPMPAIEDAGHVAALVVKGGTVTHRDRGLVKGRHISASASDGLKVSSGKDALNGVIVAGGRSVHALRGARITLSGTGRNDFLGIGAGVMAHDRAALVVEDARIETSGAASPAMVVAEGATARIFGSRLVAHGGPLPAGYTPRIGPGMLEPPAPLGLGGTARTLLAMTGSRTFLYNSRIEADGWGALSTDQSGDGLYLEANDCDVVVNGRGYGVYADFGAHVVVKGGRVDSGAFAGVIAGAARLELHDVAGRAADSAVMIHSVMGVDPAETGDLLLSGLTYASGGPFIQVRSANATIRIVSGSLTSDSGVLLDVGRNADPNATRIDGRSVPGVRLTVEKATLAGDVRDTDPERNTYLALSGASLTGALSGVTLRADSDSKWTARSDSEIWLEAPLAPGIIDAPPGVTVRIHPPPGPGGPPDKEFGLPGGGRIVIVD